MSIQGTGRLLKNLPGYVHHQFSERGLGAIPYIGIQAGSRSYITVAGNPGTPVWDRDWDVLVILDACRVDLMQEVLDEYPFLPGDGALETLYSTASMSYTWLGETFSPEYHDEIRDTAYVTGNPFTEKFTFDTDPERVDEVWTTDWNEDLNTIEARPITERAVHASRNGDADRLIVHYMQPHAPFVQDPELGTYTTPDEFGEGFADVWPHVGDTLEYEEVWAAYRDNLRYVLDDVAVLLENVDGTVAISADHGNAIGDWGMYGHPPKTLLPCIRRVPWVETTATDDHTIDGVQPPETDDGDEAVDERLRALGYR